MRVSMKRGGAPTPCENYVGGEVEDYTVDFGNGSSILVKMPDLDLNVYPNPAGNDLNIELRGNIQGLNLKLYDSFGLIIWDLDKNERSFKLDISQLKGGIYYLGAENTSETVLKRFSKN